MLTERWLPVVGYEGYYEVSDQGRVRSVDRTQRERGGSMTRHYKGQLLSLVRINHLGHRQVNLKRLGTSRNGLVHRLVLEAFVGPCPDGMECCHNDGNANNNHLENLRWDTCSANNLDKILHGTHPEKRKTHCPKGHPYAGDNLYVDANGWRKCRQCGRESHTPEKKPRATSCPAGHPYDEENTYLERGKYRHCRTCMRARKRVAYKLTGKVAS